jgi:hypothetical protein
MLLGKVFLQVCGVRSLVLFADLMLGEWGGSPGSGEAAEDRTQAL